MMMMLKVKTTTTMLTTTTTMMMRLGGAAADAAAEKRRCYAKAGPALISLALESGGCPGEDLVNFVRRCSVAWPATHDGDLSAYTRLWYECSTALQRGNAERILAAISA